LAEDLTAIEIADRFKLVGRHRRMTPADYGGDRTVRRLVNVDDPAVRGSALWFAHSVMASFHQDVSDRQTAYRRTSRQELKYAASSPAARVWLANRMSAWPERYRRKFWKIPTPTVEKRSRLPADSSGQKIPGLHLSVAYNFRGERAIGTYQESCGCQHQPMSQRITKKE
jgi:hypothetical protein